MILVVVSELEVLVVWLVVLGDTVDEYSINVLDVHIPVYVPPCVSDRVNVTCMVVVVGSCDWYVVVQGVLVVW